MKVKLTKIIAVITALFIVLSIPSIAVDEILDAQQPGENYSQEAGNGNTFEQYDED